MYRILIFLICLLPVIASAAQFNTGPVFSDFGKHAAVGGVKFDKDQQFKVVFDITVAAEPGEQSRHINSLARFINMHVANGIKESNIHLAMVVHGAATLDLLTDKAYQQRKNAANGNIALINALAEKGVKIFVCGQSAAAHGIKNQEFLPAVEVALSAMTANALLQQQGYTLNPP